MSESYQEIEATLTEMESCMRLLFPDFDLTDIQTTKSQPPNSQPANECPSVDEQPCCSKDLKDDRRERMIQDREEKKSTAEEKGGKENKGMTEEKEKKERSEDEEMKNKERRDGNEQEEENGKEVEEGDEKEGEIETAQRVGEEEEDAEEEEEGHGEEQAGDDDLFIRSSGLISHSYSLDLNLSPGGYSSCTYVEFTETLVYQLHAHIIMLGIL